MQCLVWVIMVGMLLCLVAAAADNGWLEFPIGSNNILMFEGVGLRYRLSFEYYKTDC